MRQLQNVLYEAPAAEVLEVRMEENLLQGSVGIQSSYQHYILQIPSKYNGQTVYVAFQHVQINDPQLWIKIDDVSVF